MPLSLITVLIGLKGNRSPHQSGVAVWWGEYVTAIALDLTTPHFERGLQLDGMVLT